MKHATHVRASVPTQVTILGSEADVKFDTGDEEESLSLSLSLTLSLSPQFSPGASLFRWVLHTRQLRLLDRQVQQRSCHLLEIEEKTKTHEAAHQIPVTLCHTVEFMHFLCLQNSTKLYPFVTSRTPELQQLEV